MQVIFASIFTIVLLKENYQNQDPPKNHNHRGFTKNCITPKTRSRGF